MQSLITLSGLIAQAAPVVTGPAVGVAGASFGAGLAAVGAGLATLGSGIGIGRIGGQACEAIARQPEAGGRIGTNMIISAALIEGFTFFALIICFLVQNK